MKITICGSLRFVNEMKAVEQILKQEGHEVFMPESAIEKKDNIYWENLKHENIDEFSNIKGERIKLHFDKINSSEAVLILNYDKNEKENYIGANTFLEMGYAFGVGKKIFVLNNLPKEHHYEELIAMKPICLKGEIKQII
jgi:nucleoside 2-deoxyribosyltransferase